MHELTGPNHPAFRAPLEVAVPGASWLTGLAQGVENLARQVLVAYRQYRKARAVRDALHSLDDRTLRDLGFHRDEIESVAAEFSGQVERTRIRAQVDSSERG